MDLGQILVLVGLVIGAFLAAVLAALGRHGL
jgi:hypothetical protein